MLFYLCSYFSISFLISPLFLVILSIAVLIPLYPIFIHLPSNLFLSMSFLRSLHVSVVSSNWFSFLPASQFFIKSSVIILAWSVIGLSFHQHLSLSPFPAPRVYLTHPLSLCLSLCLSLSLSLSLSSLSVVITILWQLDDRCHISDCNLMHLFRLVRPGEGLWLLLTVLSWLMWMDGYIVTI